MTQPRPIHAALVLAALVAGTPAAFAQANSWSDISGPPFKTGAGCTLVPIDADRLFLIGGGSTTNCALYTISSGKWAQGNALPFATTASGTSACFMPGTNFVYVVKSAATGNFVRCDLGTGNWTPAGTLADLAVTTAAGATLAATATKVYVLRGGANNGTSQEFYEYTPNAGAGSWVAKANCATFIGSGGSMVYPGNGDFLYALAGSNGFTQVEFLRYAITGVNPAGQAADTWQNVAGIPDAMSLGACLSAGPAGTLYATSGSNQPAFNRYDIASNTWTPVAGWDPAETTVADAVPFIPANGVGLAWAPTGDYLYFLKGGSTTATQAPATSFFARYQISKDKFATGLPLTPDITSTGACMASVGNGDEVYVVTGQTPHPLGNWVGFHKYSTVSKTWTPLADLIDQTYDSAWMVYGGGDRLYLAQGGTISSATTQFWRYAIKDIPGQAANTWQALASPGTWVNGTCGAWTGGDIIYALQGGQSNTLWQYSILGNTWSTLAASPNVVYYGGAMVWNGNDHLFVFPGGAINTPTRLFTCYCISRNQWNVRSDGSAFDPADPTVDVGRGSSLCYAGTGTVIYAIMGNPTNTSLVGAAFQTYSLTLNTWTSKADLPAAAHNGTTMVIPSSLSTDYYVLGGGGTRFLWKYSASQLPPSVPAAPGQFKLDGVTSVAQGATVNDAGVTLKATCTHPDGSAIKLQVEVAAFASAFTNSPTAESAFMASGAIISVPVTALTSNDYKWQARAIDALSQASTWVEFGTAAKDFTIAVGANTPPGAPAIAATGTTQGQFKLDGTTPLLLGETTTQNAVIFKGVATDPDGNSWRLEVEPKPVAAAFDGAGTTQSAWTNSGSSASASIALSTATSYHWRARALDSAGGASAWASFGPNLDTLPADADVAVDIGAANVPPQLPQSIGQFKLDGTTAIALGGNSGEAAVTLKGTVTDANNDPVRLEVELKAAGVAFTGAGTVTSGAVASGSVISVTIPSLLSNTNYHWRARSLDAGNRTSVWTSFGANPENPAEIDFVTPNLASNQPPATPNIAPSGTLRGQFRLNGTTTIMLGETTNQNGAVLKGVATDPQTDSWQLEVEAKPLAAAFTGSGTVLSAFAASGQSASVTVTLANGGAHWRARAVDSAGAPSGWVTFSSAAGGYATDPDFTLDTTAVNYPPLRPATPAQLKMDGVTPIAMGATHAQPAFTAQAVVTDPDGDPVRLQVEQQPVGTAFTGTPTFTSATGTSGAAISVQVTGLVPGTSYHWQCRSIDSGNRTSVWLAFGTQPDLVSETDFALPMNVAPSGSAVRQVNPGTGVTVPVGGVVYNDDGMRFEMVVNDGDNDTSRYEVEAVPVGTPFTNSATGTSGATASGQLATIQLLLPDGDYHWQYRVVDTSPFMLASTWTSFATNAETAVDFSLAPLGGSTQGETSSGGPCSAGPAGASMGLAMAAGLLALRRR